MIDGRDDGTPVAAESAAVPMIEGSVEKRPGTVNGVTSEWSPRLLTVFDTALPEKVATTPAHRGRRPDRPGLGGQYVPSL